MPILKMGAVNQILYKPIKLQQYLIDDKFMPAIF